MHELLSWWKIQWDGYELLLRNAVITFLFEEVKRRSCFFTSVGSANTVKIEELQNSLKPKCYRRLSAMKNRYKQVWLLAVFCEGMIF